MQKRPFILQDDGSYLVPLASGRGHATIDAADAELVGRHNWRVRRDRRSRTAYAQAKVAGKLISLHCLLMPGAEEVDHVDRDGLNCRRGNLRAATHAENMKNKRRRSDNTSGYKGVCFSKERGRWLAQITVDGRHRSLGRFTSVLEAAKAYDTAALKLHGAFATTNFPSNNNGSLIAASNDNGVSL